MDEFKRDMVNLQKENDILRKHNRLAMDQLITKLSAANVDSSMEQIREVMKLQRHRINLLESEYDDLYDKYQIILRKSSQARPAGTDTSSKQSAQDNDSDYKLIQLEMRNKVLEEQVEELTRTYALQFVKQKTQITEQGAQLLLTNK